MSSIAEPDYQSHPETDPDIGSVFTWTASGAAWAAPSGGGGHATALYDATTDDVLLSADNGILTVTDDVDFHSHGKLINEGNTYNGGPQPTWFDPSAEVWNEKGWFGFFYGGPFGVTQFDFQLGYGDNLVNYMYQGPDFDDPTFHYGGQGINGTDQTGNGSWVELHSGRDGVYLLLRAIGPAGGTQGDTIRFSDKNHVDTFRVSAAGDPGFNGVAPPGLSTHGTTAADAIACLIAHGLMHA